MIRLYVKIQENFITLILYDIFLVCVYIICYYGQILISCTIPCGTLSHSVIPVLYSFDASFLHSLILSLTTSSFSSTLAILPANIGFRFLYNWFFWRCFVLLFALFNVFFESLNCCIYTILNADDYSSAFFPWHILYHLTGCKGLVNSP